MLMVATTTFICEILSYIIQILVFKLQIKILPFIKILLIEILYNIIIVIIIYPLIEKAGNLLEKAFKEKKVLTKYF